MNNPSLGGTVTPVIMAGGKTYILPASIMAYKHTWQTVTTTKLFTNNFIKTYLHGYRLQVEIKWENNIPEGQIDGQPYPGWEVVADATGYPSIEYSKSGAAGTFIAMASTKELKLTRLNNYITEGAELQLQSQAVYQDRAQLERTWQ